MAMLARAFEAGVPFSWVTADEAYGQAKYFRVWLEDRDAWHVLALRCSDTLITTSGGEQRADELVVAMPQQAWRRLSASAGAHGPREYDWARIPIRVRWKPGRGHWLLARRSISDPAEIAYYVCYGPHRSTLVDLGWVAGSRWHVEECSSRPKTRPGSTTTRPAPGEPGTPTSPCPCSRSPGWRRPNPCRKRGITASNEDMIAYTLPEIRRLLIKLILLPPHTAEQVWHWSRWRRRRQHQARTSHYRRRGYPP